MDWICGHLQVLELFNKFNFEFISIEVNWSKIRLSRYDSKLFEGYQLSLLS